MVFNLNKTYKPSILVMIVLLTTFGALAETGIPTHSEGENPGNKNPGIIHHAYWVFLDHRDKSSETYYKILNELDPKCIQRRERIFGIAVLETDLPPHPDDLKELVNNGAEIRTISRWLNAVSVVGTDKTENLVSLSFVQSVRPVTHSKRYEPIINSKTDNSIIHQESLNYGKATDQVRLIRADVLHQRGLLGNGVRIGFLDSGFAFYEDHIAFNDMNVIDSWNAHDSTSNIHTGLHGTHVLSIVTANDPGKMVGVAPEVEVLLVRTEDTNDEYPQEEDFWVAGLEWAEAHGADLISTSLGYSAWYEADDYDGQTAVTTIAANMAFDRGLLVITSAGNRGNRGMSAPADGANVLSVGATDSLGRYVSFSSVGPTADGRIKPDVAAQGQNVLSVDLRTTDGYIYGHGTSYSCPAVAGAAALLLQSHPGARPKELMRAFKKTASQHTNPDTLLGWGVVDVFAAYAYLESRPDYDTGIPKYYITLESVYPNPTNSVANFTIGKVFDGNVDMKIYNLLGQEIMGFSLFIETGYTTIPVTFNGLSNGIYLYRITSSSTAIHGKIVLLK